MQSYKNKQSMNDDIDLHTININLIKILQQTKNNRYQVGIDVY